MQKKKLLHLIWIIPAALILLFFVLSCFYTVNETEKAVVTTFGKVSGVSSAGLHFKLPYPIQNAQTVDMTTRKLRIGYSGNEGDPEVKADEASMITGDYNIVSVDFFIEWKVSDPQKYLFNSEDPDSILSFVAQAAARDIIGSSTVDDILTTGKMTIQSNIKALMTERLTGYDIGVQVTDVKIQDAEPPTAEVSAAFKEVETAKQQMETAINEANAYKASVIPKANADADKIIKDAEAYTEERTNEATGQASKFSAIYTEYSRNPAVTKKRMYLEMLEEALPGVKVYINATEGGTNTVLPLESIVKGGNANG